MKKLARIIGVALLAIMALIACAWALGALYFDGAGGWFALLNGIFLAASLLLSRLWKIRIGLFVAWFGTVLGWWLSLRPTGEADWQPDVARLPWAELEEDLVTIHNVRRCEYRSEHDYSPLWETRTVRLSQLTGIDMAINYWGSPWMAHPIVSFQFADAPPLCFSIETRKKQGQEYSALGGLYRQFELIYIAADERDVLRVRTNFRKGEDVYLYRLGFTPQQARERFLEYLHSLNELRVKPRWYNAVTTNCTTAIRHQHPSYERSTWDWRMLVNGKGDELLYERGTFVTGGLAFPDLKARAHVNFAAREAGDADDFSIRIRENNPGMSAPLYSNGPLPVSGLR